MKFFLWVRNKPGVVFSQREASGSKPLSERQIVSKAELLNKDIAGQTYSAPRSVRMILSAWRCVVYHYHVHPRLVRTSVPRLLMLKRVLSRCEPHAKEAAKVRISPGFFRPDKSVAFFVLRPCDFSTRG